MELLKAVNAVGFVAIAIFQVANFLGLLFRSGHRKEHAWGLFQWFIIAIVFQVGMGWLAERMKRDETHDS